MKVTNAQEAVHSMARRIIQEFDPERIILFGSYARDQATLDSDVDLLVVLAVEGMVRQAATAIDAALADRMLPLDLIVVTPEQFERQKNVSGSIVAEAIREGKALYERAA